MHKSWAVCGILKGSRCEKNAIGTAKGPTGANTMPKNALFEATWGVKKVGFFDRKCFQSFWKIVLPMQAGSKLLKKTDPKRTQNEPKTEPGDRKRTASDRKRTECGFLGVRLQKHYVLPSRFACPFFRNSSEIIATHRNPPPRNSIFYQSVNPFD